MPDFQCPPYASYVRRLEQCKVCRVLVSLRLGSQEPQSATNPRAAAVSMGTQHSCQYSLCRSLKGGYRTIVGVIKGDTKSVDYSSEYTYQTLRQALLSLILGSQHSRSNKKESLARNGKPSLDPWRTLNPDPDGSKYLKSIFVFLWLGPSAFLSGPLDP